MPGPRPSDESRGSGGRGWRRELGASGLETSAIALGLAALGRPGYLNVGHGEDFADHSVQALCERTHAVLDAAYRAGVRHFDAARSYGRAEEFLGSWLRSRSLQPGEVTVSSKWGYTYTAGWRVHADPPEVKDLTAATLRAQLEETRAHLGRFLSLYQIHSATASSGVLEDDEVRSELDQLRRTGVAIGLSVTGTEQAATIERAIETAAFDSVQATWNLLERSAEGALLAAHQAGLGVIVKEALANGRLGPRGHVEPLSRAAKRLGFDEDAVALAAALSRPWADSVLSGASTVAQLESNMRALDVVWGDELEDELRGLGERHELYWQTRSKLPWN
jgi:aryl-alcohol dehydrogenase-like predicted oxidoreductase